MFSALKKDPGLLATVIAALANLALVGLKFAGGILGNSIALVADAFHSLSDLLNDSVVVLTYRIGRMPRDANHPYGHGRAETLGAVVIGIAILILGLRIGRDLLESFSTPRTGTPSAVAAVIALLSIVVKELLYRYTRRVGDTLHSPVLLANAWDQRSDALSSLAAFLGIFGAMNGFPILDPVGGVVVAFMILFAGGQVLFKAVRDLMDSSLEENLLRHIEGVIRSVPAVLKFHELRTRRIGGQILIDVHILVHPEMLVTEGHQVAESVRRELMKGFPNILDVMVHVDPEDDTMMERLYTLGRKEAERSVVSALEGFPELARNPLVRVHYLKGKNIVEVVARLARTVEDTPALMRRFEDKLRGALSADEIRVYLDMKEK